MRPAPGGEIHTIAEGILWIDFSGNYQYTDYPINHLNFFFIFS
jgi:hypothetical protein